MQKWILREAWKRLNSQKPELRIDNIYEDFFKLPKHEDCEDFYHIELANSKKVILCNSLRRLREKGLIKIERTDFRHFQKRRALSLTETGEQKGLMLIQEAKCEMRLTISRESK